VTAAAAPTVFLDRDGTINRDVNHLSDPAQLELLPGAADVDVRCEGGRVTLTGSVQHKRVKRDVGEIAWAIPGLHDVQNNVTIASRRRTRSAREGEGTASVAGRKQS
jgi:hypothetical protein